MRILLDECLPVKLKYRFQEISSEFNVSTVTDEGWTGIKNGELLSKAQEEFDVFLTNDQDLPYQQNVESLNIAIVIFKTESNRYGDLVKLVDAAVDQLKSVDSGKFYKVGPNDE